MAVARSVKTRLIEGMIRDFVADTDAAGYFSGGFHSGPLLDDSVISPPQVNLAILPNDVFEPGIGGVTDDALAVIVKCYFPAGTDSDAFKSGSPNLTCYDYVEHLKKIVAKGSLTGNPNPDKPGLILDPDNASGSDPLRWLNTVSANFNDTAPVKMPNTQFVLVAFIASFETRLDNVTRQRSS